MNQGRLNQQNLEQLIDKAVAEANFVLRRDVLVLLKKSYQRETGILAKKSLGWIIDNAAMASRKNLAICQDSGLPIVFVEAGRGIKVDGKLIRIISMAVEKSYEKNCLRPSLVGPFKRNSPSYQGAICHIDFTSRHRNFKITILPKGFGSENKSQLKMFNPTSSVSEIEEFIISAVKAAGPEACPPFIVGVGVGSTSDGALLLAKKALLDNIAKPNKDKYLDKFEKRLVKKINSLYIGPMGLGGKTTCLAVKIKTAPTHIAGLPVGINISCHALRSATVIIK